MSLIFDGGKAGEGGGGKPIQYETMPSPIVGDIIQYVGETSANYTQGYFYKGVGGGSGSATISQTSGSGITNLAVNVSTFESGMPSVIGSALTTGNYAFDYDGVNWNYGQSSVNMASVGITFNAPSAEFNTYSSGAVDGYVSNQQLWESKITQSGTYTFVYSESDGLFHENTISGTEVDLNEYGIDWFPTVASDPETTVNQTVGDLTIEVDPWSFSVYFGEAAGDYTLTFDGNDWTCEEAGVEVVDIEACGITITGTPQSGYTFIVSLTPPIYGPLDGDSITVEYTKGMQSGDEITVSYTEAPATWQQINVQPTPEIATQETIGGNVELSADTGVLVIATPDGTEDKQVANVEFVNNLVGDVASLLSEV